MSDNCTYSNAYVQHTYAVERIVKENIARVGAATTAGGWSTIPAWNGTVPPPWGFKLVWAYYPIVKLPDLDKVDTVTADDRGRVYLGTEFAEDDVKVYVTRVGSDE